MDQVRSLVENFGRMEFKSGSDFLDLSQTAHTPAADFSEVPVLFVNHFGGTVSLEAKAILPNRAAVLNYGSWQLRGTGIAGMYLYRNSVFRSFGDFEIFLDTTYRNEVALVAGTAVFEASGALRLHFPPGAVPSELRADEDEPFLTLNAKADSRLRGTVFLHFQDSDDPSLAAGDFQNLIVLKGRLDSPEEKGYQAEIFAHLCTPDNNGESQIELLEWNLEEDNSEYDYYDYYYYGGSEFAGVNLARAAEPQFQTPMDRNGCGTGAENWVPTRDAVMEFGMTEEGEQDLTSQTFCPLFLSCVSHSVSLRLVGCLLDP